MTRRKSNLTYNSDATTPEEFRQDLLKYLRLAELNSEKMSDWTTGQGKKDLRTQARIYRELHSFIEEIVIRKVPQ